MIVQHSIYLMPKTYDLLVQFQIQTWDFIQMICIHPYNIDYIWLKSLSTKINDAISVLWLILVALTDVKDLLLLFYFWRMLY